MLSERGRLLLRGAIAGVAGLTPSVGVVVLAQVWLRQSTRDTRAVWLISLAAMAAFGVRMWLDGRDRHPVAEVAVTGTVAASMLGVVSPVLTAVTAVPLIIGICADRRAATVRASGMSATRTQLALVAQGTAALVGASRAARSCDQATTMQRAHLATVDHFVDVFAAATARTIRWSRVAEVAFAPVSLVAAVLVVGTALDLPLPDVLACSVLAAVVAGCLSTLRTTLGQHGRNATAAGGETPPAPREVLRSLRRDEVRAVLVVAVLAAVHGGVLALEVQTLLALHRGQRPAAWPWAAALAIATAMHAVLLAHTARLAQLSGVNTLRTLSHAIIRDITTAPPERLTDEHARTFTAMATKDVVVAAGLAVHGLRPLVPAVLVPGAALVVFFVVDWRLPAQLMLAGLLAAGAYLGLAGRPGGLLWTAAAFLPRVAGTAVLLSGCALITLDGQAHPGLVTLLAMGTWLAVFVGSIPTVLNDLQPGIAARRHLRTHPPNLPECAGCTRLIAPPVGGARTASYTTNRHST